MSGLTTEEVRKLLGAVLNYEHKIDLVKIVSIGELPEELVKKLSSEPPLLFLKLEIHTNLYLYVLEADTEGIDLETGDYNIINIGTLDTMDCIKIHQILIKTVVLESGAADYLFFKDEERLVEPESSKAIAANWVATIKTLIQKQKIDPDNLPLIFKTIVSEDSELEAVSVSFDDEPFSEVFNGLLSDLEAKNDEVGVVLLKLFKNHILNTYGLK